MENYDINLIQQKAIMYFANQLENLKKCKCKIDKSDKDLEYINNQTAMMNFFSNYLDELDIGIGVQSLVVQFVDRMYDSQKFKKKWQSYDNPLLKYLSEYYFLEPSSSSK